MMVEILIQLSWMVLQMLIVAGLMFRASRLPITAAQRLLVWRMGFLIMACLPWLQPQMALIHLPWLPGNDPLISQALVLPETDTSIGLVPDQAVFTTPQWWLMAWLSISAMLIIRWCKRLSQLHQITRQSPLVTSAHWQHTASWCQQRLGLCRLPELRISDTMNTPCTWGFFKPVILLPTEVADSQTLKIILLHEMAHIKRRDWLWMSLIELITLAFWINPFLWWIRRLLLNGFETACDDLVLQQSVKPSAYAETLLQFHQHNRQHTPLAVMMAEHSALYHRLNTILNPPTRSLLMNQKKQTLLTGTLLSLMALTGFTQLTQAHQDGTTLAAPQPPASTHAPHPQPVAQPRPVAHPEPPREPGHVTPPHPDHHLSTPAAAPSQPMTPKPPMPEAVSREVLELHEHRLHEAQQRLHTEQRRVQQLHSQARPQLDQRLRHAEHILEQKEQRLLVEQLTASEVREQALEAREQAMENREQHLIKATEARMEAAERLIRTQQQRLELEQLRIKEQQEKVRREMEQTAQRAAQQAQ